MTKRWSFRLSLTLGLCLAAAPLLAQSQAPKPRERREALKPVYRALQSDPEFRRLKGEALARPADAALQEALLRFLPLSPLDYLQIDMDERHYELQIPKPVYDAHARWVLLHETKARQLYGDAHVDSLKTGWPAEPPSGNAGAGPQDKAATVGTNRNVASTDSPAPVEYQGEIQVVVNPNNPNQLVAAANTWDAPAGCQQTQAIFFSGDGGATWGYTCAPTSGYSGLGTCSFTVFGSDPALHWDDSNRVFLNHMMICSFLGLVNNYAMVVTRSTDGGATWTPHGVVVSSWSDSDLEDKNFYAIDNNPASPFYGRHYTCWDRNNNEKFAFSTNGGVSFTEVDLPTAPVGTADLGCEIAVQDNGTVHVVFDSLTCSGSTCSDEAMVYTRSTNGGSSWSAPVVVRDFNLAGFSGAHCPDAQDDRCIGPFGAIGVDNSGGACDGTLYATFTDIPAGGNVNSADVFISRSTNGGASWSAPLKVNDDNLAGRAQFHPFLQVDPANGHVVVAWHDARNDAGNDAVEIYVARSTDCGVSFEANVKASAASAEFNNAGTTASNVNSVANPNYNPNQYGEYLGLDVLNGKAYVAWSDTRHYFPASTTEPQKDNLGFAVVDFGGGSPVTCGNGVRDAGEACDGADLGGQTCAGLGFLSGTLTCTAACAFNTSACVSPPTTTTFTAVAAEDGWTLENNETSNTGGSSNSTDTSTSAIRAGDDRNKNRQYRGIVSFDTASIPDGATVLSVTLRLRRGTVVGGNPFATHGSLNADVRNGGFNGNVALENADFQAPATATAVCTLSAAAANLDWSECTFNAAGLAALNKAGKTQIRIAFTLDDDNDRADDYVGFYSANNATAANHPQLVVTYQ
ncbi:MAG TPA: DNRLRE domain-containing protein [Thermoanaerobaculia bacterium]